VKSEARRYDNIKMQIETSVFLTIYATNLRDFVTVNIITTKLRVTNGQESKEVCLRKERNS